MNYALSALVYTLSLSLGMFLLLEVSRRIGLRRRAKGAEGAGAGSGVIEGAVFALLGLLVAFTFWHWRLCDRASSEIIGPKSKENYP